MVGTWLKAEAEEEDLLDFDLAVRLAEGVAGGRAEANEGSTLAAREEEARVVTILAGDLVCLDFGVCLLCVSEGLDWRVYGGVVLA